MPRQERCLFFCAVFRAVCRGCVIFCVTVTVGVVFRVVFLWVLLVFCWCVDDHEGASSDSHPPCSACERKGGVGASSDKVR